MAKTIVVAGPPITPEVLPFFLEWQQCADFRAKVIAREEELRTYLAAVLLPVEKRHEGTNNVETKLPDGTPIIVSIDHKIYRKVDETLIDAVKSQLPEDWAAYLLQSVFRYKTELVMEGFRALPAEVLKVVQLAVSETIGMPAIAIKPVVHEPGTTAAPVETTQVAAPAATPAATAPGKKRGRKPGTTNKPKS